MQTSAKLSCAPVALPLPLSRVLTFATRRPREALLALLKARLETSALAPLEDLSGLPLKELMARAKIEHCDPDEVDEAMDADQPKPALINVIRQKLVTKLARNRMEAAEMKEMGIRQLEEDKCACQSTPAIATLSKFWHTLAGIALQRSFSRQR
jgi:hypothetical protein